MIINTLLRMENLLDLSGLKKIHRSKRDALYTFFFFCYTATRANRTGFTEYLTHLIKITANMSVTLRQMI